MQTVEGTITEPFDPHAAWARQAAAARAAREKLKALGSPDEVAERLRGINEDDVAEPFYAACDAFENAIAKTRAVTLAGIVVQLRLVMSELTGDDDKDTALTNAIASLEAMAEGRS